MKGSIANGLVLLALAAGFAGVATEWRLPWRKEAPAPGPAKADWCEEHAVPESECFV